jgi:trk system potassium uptake protein
MKLINWSNIFRILSTLLLIETVSFLVCILIALIYGETFLPFILSALVSVSASAILFLLASGSNLDKTSTRDGYMAVTLSWFVLTLFGTLPYLLSGSIPTFVNAFFESASGFSTTGSSILTNVEIMPFSILFWRSFTHWIGGIGIIVLVIIVLPSLKVSGYSLFSLESSLKEKIHPRTKSIGYRVLFIYLMMTISEVILLSAGDMELFDSICHAFGTVATGGFSTKNLSLSYYSPYSQYVVMIFMLLAGVSQLVYYYLLKLNFKKVKENEEFWLYIAVAIIAGGIATSLLLANTTKSFELAFREGFFQVISIMTCTGFSSTDYLFWPMAGLLLIFVLMFSGGSTGSTSGGIKIARHLIVLKNIKSTFIKLNHPNAVSAIKLNDRTVSENTNASIISFVILYIFLFVCGTLFIVFAGIDTISASSAVATAMAGIGPGLGTIGPMNNFAHFPDTGKVLLSLLMIVGRLEIITVFTLFTRSYWKN